MGRRLADLGWVPILGCFLTLRLFSSLDVFPIINDEPKYLALAESFPSHTLYNNQPYLIHSPVVGYVLGLFALVLPTLTAGLLVTLLAGTANFFLTRMLGKELGLNSAGQAAALLILAITELSVWVDTQVGRMGILLTFSLAALWSLLRYLNRRGRGVPRWATFWLCAALATSEQALLLFPAMALVCWFRRSTLRIPRSILASWLMGGAVFLLWPAFRLWTYLSHAHYPAGVDGTVESLAHFPAAAVLQPNLLPVTDFFRSFFTITSFSLSNLAPGNLLSFADWSFVPRSLAAVVCLVLPGVGIFMGTAKQRSAAYLLMLLALLFFLPPLVGMYARYGLGYVFFFSLLMGWGVHHLSLWVPRGEPLFVALIVVASLAISAAWIRSDQEPKYYSPVEAARGGQHFLFTREPVIACKELAHYLDALPEDGIMAPIGVVPSLAFQIDKRVLAVPIYPSRLEPLLRDYEIRYVVIARDHLTRRKEVNPTRDTAVKIASSPEHFEQLRAFEEQRPFYFRRREYLVYRVRP